MMRRIFFALGLFVFFATSSAYCESVPVREVRVEVAVSPGFETMPSWKSNFERRLGYASRIFESEFKIKFKLVRFTEWRPADETAEMTDLLDELRNNHPLNDVDIVIGLTHYRNISDPRKVRDLHTLGQARPMCGYLVIRYPGNRLYKVQEDTVLAHELGHTFGAIHVDDPDSIMAPQVQNQIPSRFDSLNREILAQTRDIDFQKGPESLPKNVLQVLLNSYVQMARGNDSADFYYALGLFYLHLNQSGDAIKVWRKAAELAPENPEMRYNLGALYYRSGDYAHALPELSQAISKFRLEIQRPMQASALTMLGEAYYAQGNFFAAYNAWMRAAAIRPDDLNIQANIATVKLKQGQTMEAIAMFENILKRDPENVKALSSMARAMAASDKTEDAIHYNQLAIERIARQPRSQQQASALSLLYADNGRLYLKINQQQKALENLSQACDLTPSPDCQKKMGSILLQNKKWDAAAVSLSKALSQKKEDAEIYGMLGTALAEKGEVANAVRIYKEGLRYASNGATEARLHGHLASIYLESQHYDLAETEFKLALAKDYKDISSHFGLAMTYLRTNQPKASMESLEIVMKLDPGNKPARQLYDQIRSKLEQQ